ncbi:MAG: preprotein translocase subunit SecE [Mycoplasmataceae bacterium]|nr:preprotein translocase subunit SecE [Mycoplasmataceae bacterium]
MVAKSDKKKNGKNWFKVWFFGLGKEFSRVTWAPKKKVIFNFMIVVLITTILVLIFLGLDYLFLNII